ncbi:MAG: helix-turn-helix domain-containing protein [Paenibacillaceae bacterium]|nr:helix-turn-helix domain-containing protein [Paenibacillaceae bacterium]
MLQIVVVEDERWIRQSICKMLEQIPRCRIAGEARDGREALRLLRETGGTHILMTDIRMPVMDGLQLVGEARQLLPNLEIVLFSGHNDFDYVREGLRLGVHDYLLKPVQPDDLERVIRQLERKIVQKQDRLPRQFERLGMWRDRTKRLAEAIWLADLPRFEAEWEALAGEWLQLDRHAEDAYEFLHLLLYTMNEHIHESYGARLPDQAFHPLDFTGDLPRDAECIRELLRAVIKSLLTRRNWRKNHMVVKALDYIEAHFADPDMSLLEAAEKSGLSSPYLSRMFKEETGQTFVEYVTELRISKARSMLSDPNAKVYEVADAVGYTDYGYFVRVFKRVVGYSPSDYRKQLGIR